MLTGINVPPVIPIRHEERLFGMVVKQDEQCGTWGELRPAGLGLGAPWDGEYGP